MKPQMNVAAVAAVADYCGIRLDPGAIVEIPSILRQSQQGASVWAAKHEGR